MNLRRLRYFIAVAEELHFGRAADRLHMAQPPLSQQIRQLESELGNDLFERTTRRVDLTSAGRVLLPHARQLVAESDRIERLMSEQQSGSSGVLRLGFVDSSSYAVMPRLLRAYRERWPGVRFELHTMSSDSQRNALRSGLLDIGIARTSGDEPDLKHTVILRERLLIAVSSSHRLASSSSIALAELANETLIGFSRNESPTLSAELASLLQPNGVVYEPAIEADEYTTIIGLVAAGEGIAIVPAAVQSFQPEGLHYLEIDDPEATSRLMLISRSGEQLRVVAQALDLATELFPFTT